MLGISSKGLTRFWFKMGNTTTITLRSQSRAVTVRAPASGGYRANPEIDQKVSVSGGGTIYTTDFGGETQTLQVQLRRLTRIEYTALKDFILTTCRGSAFPFDLTDHQGTHPNLHYISGLEGAEWHRGDLFNVTLQLEKSTDQRIRLGQNLITNPNLTLGADGKIAGWQNTTPATLRNVEIAESFASTALEVVDTDSNIEWFIAAPKIPIVDLRYTVSGRLNRTLGNRACYIYVNFFDADGTVINPGSAPNTGWGGSRYATNYYLGIISPIQSNNVWNLFSVTFGPGSNTYIPPSAKSFLIGTFIIGTESGEGQGNATCRFTDFSVVISL